MQRLFDINFLTCAFKYFSFRNHDSITRRYYYKDAIYEGEGHIDNNYKTFIKEGLGFFITSRGDIYFGEFKNNMLHGEGNFVFTNGDFMRAEFKRDKLHGKCLLSRYNGDLFIITFKYGNIDGFCTYMPYKYNCAFVLEFCANVFQRVVKQYYFNEVKAEEARIKIVSAIFENSQLNETIYTDKDITNVLKRSEKPQEVFISSILIDNSFFYSGFYNASLDFKGLGLLIDIDSKKIRVSDWVNEKMNGFGFIIEEKYLFKGVFEGGYLKGPAVVKDISKNQFKECLYEKGEIVDVLKTGEGDSDLSFMKFNNLEDANRLGYSTKKEEYIDEYLNYNIVTTTVIDMDNFKADTILMKYTEDKETTGRERTITYRNDNIEHEAPRDYPTPYVYTQTKPSEYYLQETRTDKTYTPVDANSKFNEKYDLAYTDTLNDTQSPFKIDDHHKNRCWEFEESHKKRLDYIQKNYFDNKWNK